MMTERQDQSDNEQSQQDESPQVTGSSDDLEEFPVPEPATDLNPAADDEPEENSDPFDPGPVLPETGDIPVSPNGSDASVDEPQGDDTPPTPDYDDAESVVPLPEEEVQIGDLITWGVILSAIFGVLYLIFRKKD
jgi:hypothetical protein